MVSVIISTHNRVGCVGEAIRSVLAQTYDHFELIVVDDHSTDGTHEAVGRLMDARLQYVRHEKCRGGPAARNTGISRASGEFVALLDDDDQWYAEKLEKQVALLCSSGEKTGVIYAGSELFDGDRVLRRRVPDARGDLYDALLERNMVGGCSVPLIRHACFDKVGLFDESLDSCQDWDMWLRIATEYHFDFVQESLVRLRAHRNQISSDLSRMIRGRRTMVEKHRSEFRKHPALFVIHLKRLGKMSCVAGKWREALSWFVQAVAVRQLELFKIVAWFAFEYPSLRKNGYRQYQGTDQEQ